MNDSNAAALQFRGQWYIGRQSPIIDFHWEKYPLADGFFLYIHKDQRVDFNEFNGVSVAVIGLAFSPQFPQERLASRLAPIANDEELFLNELNNLAGSYAIILFSKGQLKLFNDAGGLMGIYFEKHKAASSLRLLAPLEQDKWLDENYKFELGNDWYTGSNTAYTNHKKLIPNCSLDLHAGKYERYWPLDDFTQPYQKHTDEELVNMIVSLLRSMMTGVAVQGDLLISITGGQDSRVILAASKSIWKSQKFFTISGKGIDSDDIKISELLAKATGINHKFYPIVSTPDWLYKLYDNICAGESIGMRREISGTCFKMEGVNTIHVNGNYGALCKSYYWHNKSPQIFKQSSVMRDFTLLSKLTVEGVNEWTKTLPELKATQKYNLFYLEQRGGRWISAGENSSRLFYETFSPFNQRMLFTYICSLSEDLQHGGKLLKILTARMSSEISGIPYAKARRNWSKYIPGNVKNKIKICLNKLK